MIHNLKVNNDFNQSLEKIVELTADCKEVVSLNRKLNPKSNPQPLPFYLPTTHSIEESFQKNVLSVIKGENKKEVTGRPLIKKK